MKKLTLLICLLAALALTLPACEEDSPDCPNGPYTFDQEVDRCRDEAGRFAPDACC